MRIFQQQLIEQPDNLFVKQEQSTENNSQDFSCKNFCEKKQTEDFCFAADAKRMNRLIQARNFQCAEFNKWSMYFMVAIGALFVGFYNLWAPQTIYRYHNQLPFVVACTGYVFSIFWHWSNKGYYFWMLNWIQLITKAEKEMCEKERVYSVMGIKDSDIRDYLSVMSSANISTSKIAIFMSFVTMVIWGFLVILCARVAFGLFPDWGVWTFAITTLVISLAFSFLINLFSFIFKSDILNRKTI